MTLKLMGSLKNMIEKEGWKVSLGIEEGVELNISICLDVYLWGLGRVNIP